MSTFCQRSYHRKCQHRVVGGQKEPKSCQRSLWTTPFIKVHTIAQLTPSPHIMRFPLTQFPLTWILAYGVRGGILLSMVPPTQMLLNTFFTRNRNVCKLGNRCIEFYEYLMKPKDRKCANTLCCSSTGSDLKPQNANGEKQGNKILNFPRFPPFHFAFLWSLIWFFRKNVMPTCCEIVSELHPIIL